MAELNPSFETRPAFAVAGCGAVVAPNSPEIPEIWQRFVPRMGELTLRVGEATYGLCCPPEEGAGSNFLYVAGVEVSSLAGLPDGMIGREIPEREYAVFAHDKGLGPELGQTFRTIFDDWLPNSGYKADGIDFEYYDARFNPMTNQGTFFIYVPIIRT